MVGCDMHLPWQRAALRGVKHVPVYLLVLVVLEASIPVHRPVASQSRGVPLVQSP
jgi:hypothetical protein